MKKDLKSMKLPMSEKVTYGFGNLAATLMFTTAGSFITYYYTDVVGLSAAIVGNILLWARVFDGISDRSTPFSSVVFIDGFPIS